MGCPASKNTVGTLEDEARPATATTTETETYPNGAVISEETTNKRTEEKDTNSNIKYPPAEAFVIPLDVTIDGKCVQTNTSHTIITEHSTQKPPPKRLQKLIEQAQASSQTNSPKNISELREKLDKAEERRQNYLQQKIDNIQKTAQMCIKTIEINNPNKNCENMECNIKNSSTKELS